MKQIVDTILKENGLFITPVRKKILELFFEANHALTHGFIEEEFRDITNRQSIYRTLRVFLKKGILHIIPTTDNTTKFALSKSDMNAKNNTPKHIHFVCDKCNTTYCLYNVSAPQVRFPKKYKVQNYQIVVTGECPNCRKNT